MSNPSYHRARLEREGSGSICFRACKPCEGCGQHIPKDRTPPLCSMCAPVGQEVIASLDEVTPVNADDKMRGRCGAVALRIFDGPPDYCALLAGHPGWHRADAGTEWTERKPDDRTELREAIARWVHNLSNPDGFWGAEWLDRASFYESADALLPIVLADRDRCARLRAAEELLWAATEVECRIDLDMLKRRADALTREPSA